MGLTLQDRNGTRLADAPTEAARVDDAPRVARRERHRDRRLSVRLAAVDAVALTIGWTAGWVAVAWSTTGAAPAPSPQVDDLVVGIVASIVTFVAFGLYRAPSHGTRSAAPGTLAQALAVAAVAVTGWQAVFGDASPGLAVGAAGGGFIAVVTARYGFDVWLLGCRRQGRFLSPVVLAGTRADAEALAAFLDLNPETGFRAAGWVGSDEDASDAAPPPTIDDTVDGAGPAHLGGYGDVVDAVRATRSTGVLVAVKRIPTGALHDLLSDVSDIGLPVHLSSGLSGLAHSRLRSTPVAHEPFMVLEPLRHTATQRAVKRTIDLVVATTTLLIALPVLAACALVIRVDDGGPVLFRQTRVGRDGRTFRCLKLRTMAVDAERRLAELADRNERHGPLFKLEDDPRVTRVGAFMRSTGLDELPQLVNVLRGEMSVVGPRPAIPSEAAEFDAELQKRHVVRPGLTGLWQTEANHKASFDEYRRLDLFYVTNWSVALDLAILANTLPTLTHRALSALRRPAPPAPVPAGSSPSVAVPDEGRLATGPVPPSEARAHTAVQRVRDGASGPHGRGRGLGASSGQRRSTLFVASSGGHLAELLALAPRIPHDEATWVTFDTPQTRSALRGRDVVFVPPATTRDVKGTCLDLIAARRLFKERRFDQVISTGAAVAVAFLPLARARGMEAHYIESATRPAGPSMTGRMVATVPGINLYSQYESWAGDRWQVGGSIFDTYAAASIRRDSVRKIVVTVGMHRRYGFRRAIERLAKVIPSDVEVLWQVGSTDVDGLGIDGRSEVPEHELLAAIREADVVVTHAGAGSALAALNAGKWPVCLPRSDAFGEHVDDHQTLLATELARRDLALWREADEVTFDDLEFASRMAVATSGVTEPFELRGTARVDRVERPTARPSTRSRDLQGV